MRVLVCGSRTYNRRSRLFLVLDTLNSLESISAVVHGDARGADRLAREWALDRGVTEVPYPARWSEFGRAAGPIRNKEMLENGRPDLVVAFVDRPLALSRGTAHMVRLAQSSGLRVQVDDYAVH